MKSEDMVRAAVTSLNQHGEEGVLRIGVLFGLMQEQGYLPTQTTLRQNLAKYVDEATEPLLDYHPGGYWSVEGTDFGKWSAKRRGRPSISDSVRYRLWSRSAGHCQFPGCNEDLTRDDLTASFGVFGQIAHIVAASEDGPRGDAVRSTLLATEYENLLMLCYRHHRQVDTYVEAYPESTFRDFKVQHEGRVVHAVTMSPEQETRLLFIRGIVGGKEVHIERFEAERALPPRYNQNAVLDVDVSSAVPDEEANLYWDSAAEMLKRRLSAALGVGILNHPYLSFFAIGRWIDKYRRKNQT